MSDLFYLDSLENPLTNKRLNETTNHDKWRSNDWDIKSKTKSYLGAKLTDLYHFYT